MSYILITISFFIGFCVGFIFAVVKFLLNKRLILIVYEDEDYFRFILDKLSTIFKKIKMEVSYGEGKINSGSAPSPVN